MKALTVRRKNDSSLVCFGPDNGMYAPGYDPDTMTQAVESDYEAVQAEWRGLPVVVDERTTAKMSLRNVKSLSELLTVLEKLV